MELIELLPDWFRGIREMREIMDAESDTVRALELEVNVFGNSTHILYASAEIIARYEKMFGIKVGLNDTLDYRKERIMQKFNTIVPFTAAFLQEKLNEMYGKENYNMVIDEAESTLSIKLASDKYGALKMLYQLMWDILPAHILFLAEQEVVKQSDSIKYHAAVTGKIVVKSSICFHSA